MLKSKDINFMNRFKYLFPFILLGIIVFISLGKTLEYYFYSDDFAFIYYLQNNREFGWPYYTINTLFTPIYNLFGNNAKLYFALGIFSYFFASIAVYFFIKTLTKNKLISLLSSLIFATGYIGLDQFTMIAVSSINNFNIINVCITLIFMLFWIETKKFRYYLLSLMMFWFSIWIFPHRAFPLMLFIPTLLFVLKFKLDSPFKLLKYFLFFILQFAPFFYIGKRYGITSYGTNDRSPVFFQPEFIKEFFAVLGRMAFIKPISDLFNVVPDQAIYAVIGFLFFFVILIVSLIFFFTKLSRYARSIAIVLFLTVEGYIGNMVLTTSFNSNGPINRYLTISFMSFSAILPLFLALFLEKINNKFKWMRNGTLLVLLTFPLILVLVLESRKYEDEIIVNRSKPANVVFNKLKSDIPKLSEYNVFYFDRGEYYPVNSQFGNVLLSAAMDKTVNLAMPYKNKIENIKIPDTFDGYLYEIKHAPANKKTSFYSFYYDEKGLLNTTDKIFTLLEKGKVTKLSNKRIEYKNSQELSEIIINTEGISSLTPLKVKFNFRATPFDSSFFKYPFTWVGKENNFENEKIKEYYQKNNIQKSLIFEYLLARKIYYDTVKLDVESVHIAKQNPGEFLIDNKDDTYWLSDQSRWEVDIKPWIKLDLGEERNISRLLWRQMSDRVITEYTIFTSIDGRIWKKVSNLHQSKIVGNENLLINDFTRTDARYIKLDINKIENNLSPGLVEIEAIESEFSNIDLALAFRIKDAPFEYVKDSEELAQTYDYIRENAKLKIKVIYNKNDPASDVIFMKLPIIVDGTLHQYEFQIPAGGTQLKNIKLESNFPADFNLENIVIENLSKEVLYKQIEEKCKKMAKFEDYVKSFFCK